MWACLLSLPVSETKFLNFQLDKDVLGSVFLAHIILKEKEMKCPHCEYEHGWSGDVMGVVEGSEGEFYQLPIELERKAFYSTDRVPVYGCPSCNKLFMEQ